MSEGVSFGTHEDIGSWMDLVRSISPELPGLGSEESIEEHKRTVLRFMERHEALCTREEGKVTGVLLFSRKRNMICCLAVSPEHRGRGYGTALMERALEELNRNADITVSTFREGDPKGTAARALYGRFGFIDGEPGEDYGYPVVTMILPATL